MVDRVEESSEAAGGLLELVDGDVVEDVGVEVAEEPSLLEGRAEAEEVAPPGVALGEALHELGR